MQKIILSLVLGAACVIYLFTLPYDTSAITAVIFGSTMLICMSLESINETLKKRQ